MDKKNKKTKESVRLVTHIKPDNYNLTLKPDIESFIFTGKEIITINIDKSISSITLHSKDIKIITVEITQGKQSQYANKISYNTKAETVTFTFKNLIKKGKAKLSIVFEGIISDSLRGFYRSRYVIDGETKHIATTQFEATDARRAFPCFDEPVHKATFNVSLIIPGNHTAISNTLPVSIQEHEAGYKIVEFASTPRMSTYLLAFIIGEFEFIEGMTKDKIQVRVFTTKGKKHQAEFALEVAIKSLEFYNNYFDIPYPLPVLDLIAIPDFESAAMENWGAVTFRETAILIDKENSSLSTKQWVAIVIAHELAHQWFGNLVTMEWWTDLWLNEGFASYMENYCTDHMFPEWHVWDLYLADRYAVALRLDALANSHPIEVTVNHPDEINEIFDMVSYAKGSAVIRQLAEYLGDNTFRDGLRYYLKKHSYKNTETIHLWEAFEKISKKPIKKIMKSWTRQTGYPLVTLTKNKGKYFIEQERFFSSRLSAKIDKEKTIWPIPLQYETDNKILKIITNKRLMPLVGSSIGKINKSENSFIRTRYDKETLEKLKNEIKTNSLNVRDRLGIIRDLFALAEGGYISTVDALEFSLCYRNEKDYIVWSELANGINRVYNIISEEKWKDLYKSYVLSLFSPLAEKMTFEKISNENHSDTFLRNLSIAQAAKYGDTKIIKKAQNLFKNIKKNNVSSDLRTIVYSIVAANGNEKDYQQFKNLFLKEELHEEKDRYSIALASFKNEKLLLKTLTLALSKDVRTQDAPFIIGAVWQNSYGRDLTWKYVQKNWEIILKKYGEGGHFLSRLLSPLGNHIKAKDVNDAKKFFKKNNAPGAERTLEQVYERVYSNEAWLKSDKNDIKKWLEGKYKK
ncbi:MAG: M1 family metallopeptidase [Patescibacteria group bacterium]|nr:M1 family metallopeptidase [Patescibacteria group bacterium]